jgi:hypothetical protein
VIVRIAQTGRDSPFKFARLYPACASTLLCRSSYKELLHITVRDGTPYRRPEPYASITKRKRSLEPVRAPTMAKPPKSFTIAIYRRDLLRPDRMLSNLQYLAVSSNITWIWPLRRLTIHPRTTSCRVSIRKIDAWIAQHPNTCVRSAFASLLRSNPARQSPVIGCLREITLDGLCGTGVSRFMPRLIRFGSTDEFAGTSDELPHHRCRTRYRPWTYTTLLGERSPSLPVGLECDRA